METEPGDQFPSALREFALACQKEGQQLLALKLSTDEVQQMFTPDWEIDDMPCPHCGNPFTHSRTCDAIGCEDGFIDEYDDDPINYSPGESLIMCDECYGIGIQRWCRKCGKDTAADYSQKT
jgi:hypothetical protein